MLAGNLVVELLASVVDRCELLCVDVRWFVNLAG